MDITASSILGGTFTIVAIPTALFGGIVGLFIAIGSLPAALGIWLASLMLFTAGLLATARTRNWLTGLLDVNLSGGAAGLLVTGLAITSVFIFTIAVIGGLAAVDTTTAGTNDAGASATTPTSTEAGMITGPPGELLPTIDDFDSDWSGNTGGESAANETAFVNTQTQSSVRFMVRLHDSTAAARDDYQNRKQSVRDEGRGTDPVEAGEQGFMYKPGKDVIYIHFRQQNVVGSVKFYAGAVLTPESNARDFADLLEETITR